jgi:hypothetical protein
VDNEIQIQNTERENSEKAEGSPETWMRSEGDNGNKGECGERPCPHAAVVSAEVGAEQDSAVSEREKLKNAAGRIPGTEEKILGAAFVVCGIFLQNDGSGNG